MIKPTSYHATNLYVIVHLYVVCINLSSFPYMDVSSIGGTPKSSIIQRLSSIKHPLLATPVSGKHHIEGVEMSQGQCCSICLRLFFFGRGPGIHPMHPMFDPRDHVGQVVHSEIHNGPHLQTWEILLSLAFFKIRLME